LREAGVERRFDTLLGSASYRVEDAVYRLRAARVSGWDELATGISSSHIWVELDGRRPLTDRLSLVAAAAWSQGEIADPFTASGMGSLTGSPGALRLGAAWTIGEGEAPPSVSAGVVF